MDVNICYYILITDSINVVFNLINLITGTLEILKYQICMSKFYNNTLIVLIHSNITFNSNI